MSSPTAPTRSRREWAGTKLGKEPTKPLRRPGQPSNKPQPDEGRSDPAAGKQLEEPVNSKCHATIALQKHGLVRSDQGEVEVLLDIDRKEMERLRVDYRVACGVNDPQVSRNRSGECGAALAPS